MSENETTPNTLDGNPIESSHVKTPSVDSFPTTISSPNTILLSPPYSTPFSTHSDSSPYPCCEEPNKPENVSIPPTLPEKQSEQGNQGGLVEN